jgi:crotonobetainyl-CoA:carnitine CoA-transferase CaiB-like acyl-CoA transferase
VTYLQGVSGVTKFFGRELAGLDKALTIPADSMTIGNHRAVSVLAALPSRNKPITEEFEYNIPSCLF